MTKCKVINCKKEAYGKDGYCSEHLAEILRAKRELFRQEQEKIKAEFEPEFYDD